MALAKVGRKLRRTGKDAFKFKFTALCEELHLALKADWSPTTLTVTFQRGHRRVSSSPALWKVEDGSKKQGTAAWDPPSAMELMVTLYKSPGEEKFEEKEYKFQIENRTKDGETKVLASFYCNVADYANLDGSHRVLQMRFKPSSKKIATASLDVTVETEFVKQGKAGDEDMMSTFSRVSRSSLKEVADEDEDDEAVDQELEELTKKQRKASKATEKTLANLADKDDGRHGSASRVADWLGTSTSHDQGDKAVDALLMSDSIFTKAALMDMDGASQPIEKLLTASIIGVYFAAEWCPPSHDFIPKLATFYNEVKSKSGSFEILWVSSDKTKDAMLRYARSTAMPWLMLEYDHPLGNELRDEFEIASIPTLYVVDSIGNKLDHLGRKTVEKAVAENTAWSAFNLWQANASSGAAPATAQPAAMDEPPSPESAPKAQQESSGKTDSGEQKKGILQTVSGFISGKKEKDKVQREVAVSIEPVQLAESDKTPAAKSKSHGKSVRGDYGKAKAAKEAKDVYIEELEAKNEGLSGEVEKLREEVDELQMMVQELRQQVDIYEREKKTLEKHQQALMVKLNLKGWLFKRGVKGPTRNFWRRRWFSLDDNGRLFYFAEDNDKSPKGFIDLNQMTAVQEKSPETQDKNNASFNVVTLNRTYELMAHDRDTMQQWIKTLDSFFSQQRSVN